MCRGQPVVPSLQLQNLVDLWFRTASTSKKVPASVGSSAKDFVMVLSYCRKVQTPWLHESTLFRVFFVFSNYIFIIHSFRNLQGCCINWGHLIHCENLYLCMGSREYTYFINFIPLVCCITHCIDPLMVSIYVLLRIMILIQFASYIYVIEVEDYDGRRKVVCNCTVLQEADIGSRFQIRW